MWRVARNIRAESSISHLSESFGDGHLGQTVLPATVSLYLPKTQPKFKETKTKKTNFLFSFRLQSYRMVHNLVSYDMIREDYQEGWIQAAASRGVTEDIIQKFVALLDN